jgi:hypothetical protein
MGFVEKAHSEMWERLDDLGIGRINGAYDVGEFSVRIFESGRVLVFGRRGQARHALIANQGKTLMLGLGGSGQMVLVSKQFTPKLIRRLGNYHQRPYAECEYDRNGNLTYLKVLVTMSKVVSYRKNGAGAGYSVFSALAEPLSSVGLSEEFEEMTEILGQPLVKKIDFDREVDEVIDASLLEEFLAALEKTTPSEKTKTTVSRD